MSFQTTTTVTVDHTAEEWELYTVEAKTAKQKERLALVANELNAAVERAVRNSETWVDAWDYAWPTFCKHGKFGASDTEPTSRLREILNRCFPQEAK